MATDIGRIVLPDPEQLRRTLSVCGSTDAKHSGVASIPENCPRVQGERIPCSAEQTTTRHSMKTKRKFAHRTKTGCGTCKRRKKKCDEAKPQCNNCTRGNFKCDGYKEKTLWRRRITPMPGPLTAGRGRTTPGAGEPCSLTHIPNREASGRDSQQNNPHLYPPPLTDGAGVGSRTIAVDEQGYRTPAQRSLHTDWGKPPQALDPSVRPPTLPPLQRPSILIDEEDAEAKSHGGDHTAAEPTMMLPVARHQRAQRLQTPPSRNTPLSNIRHIGNRETPLGESLEPRIVIGDNVTIGSYCQLHGLGKITVGCNSSIGAYVTITTDPDSQVFIGDNVDIGKGCTIGAGVRIGHRTAVPSGSVVVYDVLTE